jgi:hypothetical protein
VAKTEIKIRLIKFAFIVVHPNHYPRSLPKTREILPTSPIRPLALSASTHVPSHFQSPINGPCSVADTDHTQPSAILLSLYLRNKDKSTIAQRLHHRPNLHHYIPFLRRTIHTPLQSLSSRISTFPSSFPRISLSMLKCAKCAFLHAYCERVQNHTGMRAEVSEWWVVLGIDGVRVGSNMRVCLAM